VGDSYLPDKDKLATASEPYLPPGVEPKKEETVKIISVPPPIISDYDYRAAALNAAAHVANGAGFLFEPHTVLAHAHQYEAYLRGREDDVPPART